MFDNSVITLKFGFVYVSQEMIFEKHSFADLKLERVGIGLACLMLGEIAFEHCRRPNVGLKAYS